MELAARAIRRPTRGLRLRLSLFYTVFFTLILTSVMVGFREYLARSLDLQIRGALESDWALFKGYYRPEKGTWTWLVDEGDQDVHIQQTAGHRIARISWLTRLTVALPGVGEPTRKSLVVRRSALGVAARHSAWRVVRERASWLREPAPR